MRARPLALSSFDTPLGEKIIDLHTWAVRQGLVGADATSLFDGLCQRLVASGLPLVRAFAGMRTLHPQWGGYSYTWARESNATQPAQLARGEDYEHDLSASPFGLLINELRGGSPEGWPLHLRRRLVGPEARIDFPLLAKLAAGGATDYFAEVVQFGPRGDASRGTGIGYSFATDSPAGFADNDLVLLQAVLPAVSLAMMAHAGFAIASGLLEAYLGGDAGRRVHAGAIERGSVETIRAVLWYADIRGFTAIAETNPGIATIDMLNDVFETLTSLLRPRGGQVLKFLGDGMLAIFPCAPDDEAAVCRQALDAAAATMCAVARLAADRRMRGAPHAEVDLALHVGDVLYGNIGAVDRLDFTVIGPAVNEVARIEALCEPLGCNVLVSAKLAAAVPGCPELRSLGHHTLRGVRDPREIYALELSDTPAARSAHPRPQG